MTVVSLLREDKQASSNGLYRTRKRFGLSLSQAAVALGLSSTQIERDELRDRPMLDLKDVEQAFEVFITTNDVENAGKNLLFGYMPLRVARDVLDLSVEKIAEKYKMSASHWRKMECHARILDEDILKEIEEEVVSHFDRLCS